MVVHARVDCGLDCGLDYPGFLTGVTDAAPLVGGSHRPDAILLVDVAAELDDAVLGRPGRNVDEVQRHGFFQRHIPTLAARSEERRVGKECRAEMEADDDMKK